MTSVISEKFFNWINEYFSALLDTVYYMRITSAREYQQLGDKSTDFSTIK